MTCTIVVALVFENHGRLYDLPDTLLHGLERRKRSSSLIVRSDGTGRYLAVHKHQILVDAEVRQDAIDVLEAVEVHVVKKTRITERQLIVEPGREVSLLGHVGLLAMRQSKHQSSLKAQRRVIVVNAVAANA